MYEALYAPIPDVNAYLDRLGLTAPLPVSLETLDEVLLAHQCRIPFENLQCFEEHQEPSLEIPALFDKIIVQGRGGFCFELNALLEALLQTLGFDAWSVTCRIVRGKDFIPPMLHRGVLVQLDGRRYYCDVGYGGPQPSFAVPLDGRREKNGEVFWGESLGNGWYAVSRLTSQGVTERVFEFLDQRQPASYFVPYSFYCARHPDSLFAQHRIINLRTKTGSLALTDDTLMERDGDAVTEVRADNKQALSDLLLRRFGIHYTFESV